MLVIKRDGTEEPFNSLNIINVIYRANAKVDEIIDVSVEEIADSIEDSLDDVDFSLHVDTIHKEVENTLMDYGLHDTAREYITYRERNKKNLFKPRTNLLPYEYPELVKYKDAIRASYWTHTEFDYSKDKQDMLVTMSEEDVGIAKRAMLSISQIEVAVKSFWGRIDMHIPKPEVSAVGATFSESEQRHSDAYSALLELMGLQNEFKELGNVPAMGSRIKYLNEVNKKKDSDDPKEYFEAIILFSTFVEYVSLFSQFYILMDMNRRNNVLSGISNAIQATSKEEECFIEGTEIMTPQGWIPMEDMQVGDTVYQYKEGVWEPVEVLNAVHKEYEGEVIKFSQKCRECIVTPNHRMVYYDSKGEQKEELAEDFRGNDKRFIPQAASVVAGGDTITAREALLIAFQADGSASYWHDAAGKFHWRGKDGGYNSNIFIKKDRKKVRLRKILQDAGISYKEYPSKDREGYVRFSFHLEDANKYKNFSWVDLTNVSKEWCTSFILETLEWDGSHISDGYGLYATTNKECADIVQLIGTLAGLRAHISKRIDNRSDKFKDTYKVNFTKDREMVRSHALSKETLDYIGSVHCVSVPSGVIMTRHNSKLFITGNCHGRFGFELINIIKEENPDWWTEELKSRIVDVVYRAYDSEKGILEWVVGYQDDTILDFIEHRINRAMEYIGIPPLFRSSKQGEWQWFEVEMQTTSLPDFFNKRVTNYSKRQAPITAESIF